VRLLCGGSVREQMRVEVEEEQSYKWVHMSVRVESNPGRDCNLPMHQTSVGSKIDRD
jgi:hypothetical protein